MLLVKIHDEAAEDITLLTIYGADNWGVEQAELYYSGLYKQFDVLAQFPDIGLPVGATHPDLLKFSYVAHNIVFSIHEDHILIRRVFGSTMDILRHL